MKKVIAAFFALLCLILAISGAIAAENKNKPEIMTVDNYIAVFDFEVTTSDKGIARPLTESVRREIVLSGKYKVIDRGNMEKILGEQKLQMSGCVTGECIVEAGQLLGVGKLISGTVSMVGKTYYLTLSLISVKTGEIENVAEDTCKCEVDELIGSTKRLAKKLLGEKVEQPVATSPKPATVDVTKPLELKPIPTTIAIVPPAALAKETAKDGRFIAYDNGTVLDTRTNLMWAAMDNGSNINLNDAKNYCENYRGGGYSDWRMPTQDEQAGLYDGSVNGNNGYNLTTLITLTACCPWVAGGSNAANFNFSFGIRNWHSQSWGEFFPRVLPVRNAK
jgi:hypothetical protein